MELHIESLTKSYGAGVRALDDVTLHIKPGMFGLLGPNGAGKSTLMRTLATLQAPDSGSIRLGELDVLARPAEVRKVLGYLPQEFGLYPNLSAEAVLDYFAALKGVTVAGERKELVASLLQQTNLWAARKKSVGGFSGGMKQRLGIAIALSGRPKLLIVDEPTAGLDPTERYRFLNLLAEIGEEVIVILSTHIVEDVRELCRRMAILNGGRVVLEGDPASVLDEVRGRLWRRRIRKAELGDYRKRFEIISTRLVGGDPVITVYSSAAPGEGFAPVEPALEDVYFHRVGAAALGEG
ncbi:MAG: ABC transporter ATP-binding protein [Polyangiaceae bacterium]|jgi:ABC-2 type transport system ATP-binding protein|nr:ABC transporter ATP-binding protein [Polyangiaceae bacterium]